MTNPPLTGFGFVNPNRAAAGLLAAGVARGRVAARGGLANPLPAGVRICQSEPSGGRAARRRELLAA
ncbi:hypothetical protein QUF80_04275, partial [Desulfococcaceae bacterium HSG8]|nr:hypothetical protein [Desulfococcaceae bacterium HSG8]